MHAARTIGLYGASCCVSLLLCMRDLKCYHSSRHDGIVHESWQVYVSTCIHSCPPVPILPRFIPPVCPTICPLRPSFLFLLSSVGEPSSIPRLRILHAAKLQYGTAHLRHASQQHPPWPFDFGLRVSHMQVMSLCHPPRLDLAQFPPPPLPPPPPSSPLSRPSRRPLA